jgi:hypothetical protein
MNPRCFIFGDSHAGTLSRAAQVLALDFAGGSVMAGLHMNDIFFKVEDGRFEMLSELGRERLAKRLADSRLGSNLLDIDMPIVSTVGFNAQSFASQFQQEGLAVAGSSGERFISRACFEAVVEDARCGALEFYRALKQAGKTVYAVLPPQRFSEDKRNVFKAFEAVMIHQMSAMGVGIVDVRAETTGSDGVCLPQFASTSDRVHANDAFGEVVFGKLFEMLNREAHAPRKPAGFQPARPAPRAQRASRVPAPRPHR